MPTYFLATINNNRSSIKLNIQNRNKGIYTWTHTMHKTKFKQLVHSEVSVVHVIHTVTLIYL